MLVCRQAGGCFVERLPYLWFLWFCEQLNAISKELTTVRGSIKIDNRHGGVRGHPREHDQLVRVHRAPCVHLQAAIRKDVREERKDARA